MSPSKYELNRLQNTSEDLKQYTRELMRNYVISFNRDINGRQFTGNDLKYYAKIKNQRTYKGTDIQVKENQPYTTKMLDLKNELLSCYFCFFKALCNGYQCCGVVIFSDGHSIYLNLSCNRFGKPARLNRVKRSF